MKHNIFAVTLALLALLILSFISIPITNTTKEAETKARLIAGHIYDELNATISRPILISHSMSADRLLSDAIKKEGSLPEKEMEKIMASYLTGIKNTFGYTAAFVISEKTHRYYTPNGISKIIKPESDPYDLWYQLFLRSGKQLNLDTDRDEVYNYRWTVFLNSRLNDTDGTLLGVCGVGLFMDDLQNKIEYEEKMHGIKINFINKQGLVQVDTDYTNIENAYISEAIGDNAGAKEFTYKMRSSGGWRMVRYMEELEWYLVIQQLAKSETTNYLPAIIFLYILILAIAVLSLRFKNKGTIHSLIKSDVTTDSLTQLPNRNYVRDSFGEQGIFNTTRYKSLAMFDIDCFKTINETRDGNAILLDIVGILSAVVGNRGLIFRWAGDEFVCFLEMEAKEAEGLFKGLCSTIKSRLDVTISVGIVEVDLTESIKTNYHRAVQLCYTVKEHGGNGVKRKA